MTQTIADQSSEQQARQGIARLDRCGDAAPLPNSLKVTENVADWVNTDKQHQKLVKLEVKAKKCLT